MTGAVRRRYEAWARKGEIVPDAEQRALADALDALAASLQQRKKKSGAFGWLSKRRGKREGVRGLYIWGGVGRGKTLLMDIFFAAAPVDAKRRMHFHEFMGDVHERIAAARGEAAKKGAKGNGAKPSPRGGDPIVVVAERIASEIALLCFDELAVYDIADAMILGRLFGALFERGVVVVATTNVAPDDLYKDGLNRALFVPFVALLKQRMSVFHLDAPRDYRLDKDGGERRYVTPLGDDADDCLDAHFRHLAGGAKGERRELRNKGRRIVIPKAAEGVARFAFEDLCGRPLGAGDYLKIADAFPTVGRLSDVPVLSAARRNEAKRFINLIDAFYDKHVLLIVSAEAEPPDLWQGTEGAETFEFARTASRLIEMRSDAYWETAGVDRGESVEADVKNEKGPGG